MPAVYLSYTTIREILLEIRMYVAGKLELLANYNTNTSSLSVL